MRHWIPALLVAASLHAAVIRGTVVTHEGGEPLSQTAVTLRAIAGTGGATLTTKTGPFGLFEFPYVAPGAYLLSATRQFYVPANYGQKRWNSAGLPIVVEEGAAMMLNIRMHRYGVITGRVVDENDVGILAHEVIAYKDVQPMSVLARATTDDYGRYRLYGLTPGVYLVRSTAKRVDGAGYVPTYAPSSKETDQARRVDVQIDLDSPGIDVHPAQGRLFDIAGVVKLNGGPFDLTLAGETGRQTLTLNEAVSPFQFNALAPGRYELYGSMPAPCAPVGALMGLYLNLNVQEDKLDFTLSPSCVPNLSVSYGLQYGGNLSDTTGMTLHARRKDLAGIVSTMTVPNAPLGVTLTPGQWDLLLQPDNGYAVTGFSGPSFRTRYRDYRADGWNEITMGDAQRARFTLSKSPTSIHGTVIGTAHEPVMGAPVYLEGYDSPSKSRIGELRTAITDSRGGFHFEGLAQGTYRILATFEYAAPDTATIDTCEFKSISIGRTDTVTQDLDLFVLK